MKKNLLSLLMLCMLSLSTTAYAAWDGTAATSFAGGDGTKANPYLISNAEQLAKLAADVNSGASTYGKYYQLANDIVIFENVMDKSTADLRAGGAFPNFSLIGDYASEIDYKAFQGTFDGAGHTISGLHYFDYVSYSALFRCLDKAVVKNLGIIDSYIFGNANTGGIASYVVESKIINCYLLDAMVDGHGSYGSGIAAHCIGKVYVANCFVSSTVALGTSAKGKIWGKNNLAGIAARISSETVIENCYNNVQLTPTKENKSGLVCEAEAGATLLHCYYRDNVPYITYNHGAVFEDVVGYASADFKGGVVLDKLNENSKNIPGACRWQYVSGSAPVFNYSEKTEEAEETDPAELANTPIPADGEQHAAHDNGTITLSWTGAADGKTATQKVYLSDDKENLVLVAELGTETTVTLNVALNTMHTYYWRVDRVTAEGQVTAGTVWSFFPRQLAFRGAEGYGRFARGGRGGRVVYVTNLNASGPGSFRALATDGSGPRTIMFAVSGVIDLKGADIVTDDNVTIAGQSAIGKGICFIHGSVGISNDNICRFVRSRRGGGKARPTDPNPSGVDTGGSLGFHYSNNAIFDHCTASWGTDETYSSRSCQDITFQRCMISEALGIAGHRKYDAGTNHGYAATIGGDIGSHHHNLLANCTGRNWSMGGGTDANGRYGGRLDIFNNVVYNWTSRTTDGGAHEINFVGNYYKMGYGSKLTNLFTIDIENNLEGTQSGYVHGNIRENMNGSLTQDKLNETYRVTIRDGRPSCDWQVFVDAPFFPSYAKIETAQEAYKSVMSDVGANLPMVDDTDARIVWETLNKTYTYVGCRSGIKGQVDDEANAGGYEVYPEEAYDDNFDSDWDGLPNWWEEIVGTNPNSASGDFTESNTDADGDGFTWLDDYLDFKANVNHIVAVDTTLRFDAAVLFKGYTQSPVYSVENVSDKLQVSVNGAEVTVKPAADKVIDEFTLKVIDAEGHSYERRICIGVHTQAVNSIESIAPEKEVVLRSFAVYTTSGQLVQQGRCSEGDSYNTLPLGTLEGGVYVMTTTDVLGNVKSYKIVKR